MINSTVDTIIKQACYEMSLVPPSNILSTTDTKALQLMGAFYATGRKLRRECPWQQLKKKHTITTVDSQSRYPLPQDYYQILPGTYWDETNQWPILGPDTDATFLQRKYGYFQSENRTSFRIVSPQGNPNNTNTGQIEVHPTPGASSLTLSFEYISSTWLLPKNWATSTAYTSGTYVNSFGEVYLCDTNGTSSSSVTSAPSTKTNNIADGTTQWDWQPKYDTVLATTDYALFDDDLMILGVKANFRGNKGQDNSDTAAAFNNAIASAQGRWEGSVLSSGNKNYGFGWRLNIPEGFY